jgi:transposase
MEGGSDAVCIDGVEDVAAGGELRVVKRCLKKALTMSREQKEAFTERIEELVCSVSRIMHHGSLLATYYVLSLMEANTPPTDKMLTDQMFWRQFMVYSKTSTRAGLYPEIKAFADERRHLIPDSAHVKMDCHCVNTAARKLRASVLTMLSHRFYQRVTSATKAMFPDAPRFVWSAVTSRCLGRSGGGTAVLNRRMWQFIEAVRGDIFQGANVFSLAVEEAVGIGKWVKSDQTSKEAVCRALLSGAPPQASHLSVSGGVMAGHVVAFLSELRAASGPVADERIAELVASRLPPRTSAATRGAVVRDIITGSNEAPTTHGTFIKVARSMLRFAGVISVAWLKKHPSRALVAIRRMMIEVEEGILLAEKEGRKRRPKRFPLLPIFGQRRQMISIDAATLLWICKESGILKKEATKGAMNIDFKRSIFRVSKGFSFSENTSIETDGVAIVLRVFKERVMAAPKIATASDLEGLIYSRVISNDPGRRQIATTVEWNKGHDDRWVMKPGSKRLTRDEYYNQAGINKRMAKRRKRDLAIAAEADVLRQASLKTSSVDVFEASLEKRMKVVDELWKHKLKRWTSMADMSGFAARRKTIDRFWRHKVGLEESPQRSKTVVVFGDGSFPATGKRERAVPRKAMEAAASRFAMKVVKVREAYTTKVCSTCHEPTDEVKMLRWKKSRAGVRKERRVVVQELRRCVSNACSATSYKSRDEDAAISIFQIFMAGSDRPFCYTKEGYTTAMAAR